MKNYETAGAWDAARMVRRGIFGYLLTRFVLIPLFVLSVIVFQGPTQWVWQAQLCTDPSATI